MPPPRDVKELFSLLQGDAPMQAAFLITGDGAILSSWMRVAMPERDMAVMSATMMASIATIVEVFGFPTPRTVLVNMGDHQVLTRKVGRGQALILVSSKDVHKQNLYLVGKRLAARLEAIYRHAGAERLRDPDAVRARDRSD